MAFSSFGNTRTRARSGAPALGEVSRGTVAVVGLGYVGLPLALSARRRGWSVTGIDIDERKREQIAQAAVPDLSETNLQLLRKEPLTVSGSFEGISRADVIVICVPTPVDHDHEPDLTPLVNASRAVAPHLRRGQLVISESTVHPGTAEEVIIPVLEEYSGLVAGEDFGVAHCPERMNPGDAFWPLERIPRVVGATSADALSRAATFYRSVLQAPVREMGSIREAEAVKMVENCFRDVNIAFVNELAMSFSRLGIDVARVLEGASTKPFGFLYHAPGCGVGGHCIPVDPYYLIRYARLNGFSHRFLSLARDINNGMPAFTVELTQAELAALGRSLMGAKIALLGLSYKAGVSDLRESPSFEIEAILKERGAQVASFDPYALESSNAGSLAEALSEADAAIIATAHPEFKELSPGTFTGAGVPVVIDGRNCLPKDDFLAAGVRFRGIGR